MAPAWPPGRQPEGRRMRAPRIARTKAAAARHGKPGPPASGKPTPTPKRSGLALKLAFIAIFGCLPEMQLC